MKLQDQVIMLVLLEIFNLFCRVSDRGFRRDSSELPNNVHSTAIIKYQDFQI